MGLLSHITNASSAKGQEQKIVASKNRTGLLARVEDKEKKYSSLEEWAKDKNFSHYGVFTCIHGMMVISHAYGFTSQIIGKSVSSRDFWNGSLKSKEVFNFSKKDNDFYSFLQFFPFELKNCVQHISFIKGKVNDNLAILMVYNTDEKCEINLTSNDIECFKLVNLRQENYLESITENKYYLYNFSFAESALKAINLIEFPEQSIRQAVLDCISNEIFSLIKFAFPLPDLVNMTSQNKINFALKNKIEDEELFQNHLQLVLSTVLGKESKSIKVNFIKAENEKELIYKFLEN